MKRNVTIFISMLLLFSSVKAQAPDWGIADTLAHHPLGPGIQYTNIYFKGKKMLIWVTEIDMTNPYNKIEQVQSRHQVPDTQRWTVMEHYAQNTRPEHKVCVAFNHDFFSYEAGACIGINVSEGEIPYGDGGGRSLIAINEQKEIGVFKPSLDANIILPDNSKVKIDHFNSQAQGIAGNCVLFNRFNARTLGDGGKYIKILPKSKWTVNGDDIQCEVLEISDQPIQTTQTEYIIYLRGEKQTAFDGKLQVGDEIYISQKMTTGTFGTPLENILNAFHGYPSIAFEGQLHDGEYNNFENGREYEISSRQMAGMSQDGKTLYIVTTEMSATSVGVNCIDITNYMLANGSWNVVNFDSGGSTAIVVDNEMLNYPARGAVRPVQDALLAVSLAPESTEIATYRFLVPSTTTAITSEVSLTLLAFNEFDEVLEKDSKGFVFTCIPENLGNVDENQIFRAGTTAANGIIVAEKDGKTAEIKVTVKSADKIDINPDNILIDRTRNYPINVEATVDNTIFIIDPGVLTWNIENEQVCNVENGILKGLENGESDVTGIFGSDEKTLKVKVEIGQGKQIAESFDDMSDVEINSAGTSNLTFSKTNFPTDWQHGSTMEFEFIEGRAPFIDLTKEIIFYGLPDSISWTFKNEGNIIKEIHLYLEDTNGGKLTQKISTPDEGEQELIIPFMDNTKVWDVNKFPITLKMIKIMLNTSAGKTQYHIPLGALYAHYPEGATNVTEIEKEKAALNVYVVENELFINYELKESADVQITIHSIDGKIIKLLQNKIQNVGLHQNKINIFDIRNGIYIVKVLINGNDFPQKIIINK